MTTAQVRATAPLDVCCLAIKLWTQPKSSLPLVVPPVQCDATQGGKALKCKPDSGQQVTRGKRLVCLDRGVPYAARNCYQCCIKSPISFPFFFLFSPNLLLRCLSLSLPDRYESPTKTIKQDVILGNRDEINAESDVTGSSLYLTCISAAPCIDSFLFLTKKGNQGRIQIALKP